MELFIDAVAIVSLTGVVVAPLMGGLFAVGMQVILAVASYDSWLEERTGASQAAPPTSAELALAGQAADLS